MLFGVRPEVQKMTQSVFYVSDILTSRSRSGFFSLIAEDSLGWIIVHLLGTKGKYLNYLTPRFL